MRNQIQHPDERLWVRMDAAHARPHPASTLWMIMGSCHTHRGHFQVVAEGTDDWRSVNLPDIAEASDAAKIWLDGFLAGQEPNFDEFMADERLREDADTEDELRFDAYNADFRRTGVAPRLNPLPPLTPALTAAVLGLGAPQPWCWAAGLYRVVAHSGWEPADPQPVGVSGNAGFWPGTSCAGRRFHKYDERAGLYLCVDCHLVDDVMEDAPPG